jgi:beta-fructofuranosidase
MYSEPGKYACDFCIIERDSVYHMFHIRGNRSVFVGSHNNGSEEDIGHATSDDLIIWNRHDPVVPRGNAGTWEGSKVFAPDVVERDGLYYMFCTGVSRYVVQSIGVATSRDLYHWEKHAGNPLIIPGDWADWSMQSRRDEPAACRDGMVFLDKRTSRYVIYYTATMADGRACIGTSISENLLDWKDNGPTYVEDDRTYNRLESPYLCEDRGRFYLFYSGKGRREDHWEICYLRSDSPTGPWEKPANHILLEEWGCASEHPELDGQRYMFFIMYEKVRGVFHRGKVSDPVLMRFGQDGTLRLAEHVSPAVPRRRASLDRFVWYEREKDPVGVIPVSVTDIIHVENQLLVSVATSVNLSYRAQVRVHGEEAGLAFRLDERGDSGYFVTLAPDEKKLRFFKRTISGSSIGSTRGEAALSDELIQERKLPCLGEDRFYEIKVLVKGEFFEIYLDDDLAIVRADYDYLSGHLGLYTRGAADFRRCELEHLDVGAEHFWGRLD